MKDLDSTHPTTNSQATGSKLEEENRELAKKLSAATEKIQSLTAEKNKLTAFMASTKELIHKLKDDQQTKVGESITLARLMMTDTLLIRHIKILL